jgi:hypothetical protein
MPANKLIGCSSAEHYPTKSCTTNLTSVYTLTCQHCHACKEAHRLQQPLEGAAAEDATEVTDVPTRSNPAQPF